MANEPTAQPSRVNYEGHLRLTLMSKRGWLLFAALGIIWGTPYLLIRVAVTDLAPSVVVVGRMLLGLVLLLPLAMRGNVLKVWRSYRGPILAFAAAEMIFPFGALAYAEKRISSSLAGLLIAAVPLVTAVLLHRIGHEDTWDRRRLLGLFVGLCGVGSLVGLDLSAENWWSIAITFIAVFGYALGPIIINTRLAEAPQIAVISLAQLVTIVAYAPILVYQIIDGSWRTQNAIENGVPMQAWLAVAGLGAICTALAFVLLFKLIDEVGPGRTTVITYINPAVAILLGITLLDEQFTPGIAVGFPLVLLGSILATRKSKTS